MNIVLTGGKVLVRENFNIYLNLLSMYVLYWKCISYLLGLAFLLKGMTLAC